MIYNLRKKFIIISALSVGVVFTLIFGVIYLVSNIQLNKNMDMFTDVISGNDGKFPNFDEIIRPPERPGFTNEFLFTPDSQFSTRFFTVWMDENNTVVRTNVEHISSVSYDDAIGYVEQVIKNNKERGWISNYRYKMYDVSDGKAIVFVNGEVNKGTTLRLLSLVFSVMLASFIVILLLIILISKRVVRPVAESYEKQRQFITDANHELKTPLTLILSNIDIVESEIGKNEWLEDIRCEGNRMGVLINQLVLLSRMDEDSSNCVVEKFDISNTVLDMVSEFEGFALKQNKKINFLIEPSICYYGDEGLIRRLMVILLDNAIKYCDVNGSIDVSMQLKVSHPVIIVENTYKDVDKLELNKLFDRFYRADKVRTYTGSFGIGLSIAKGIAKQHKGDIVVYKKSATDIGFKVILK